MSVNKHSSGEEDMWEDQFSEHQIRGRIEVVATGLHCQGLYKRSVCFSQTPAPSMLLYSRSALYTRASRWYMCVRADANINNNNNNLIITIIIIIIIMINIVIHSRAYLSACARMPLIHDDGAQRVRTRSATV